MNISIIWRVCLSLPHATSRHMNFVAVTSWNGFREWHNIRVRIHSFLASKTQSNSITMSSIQQWIHSFNRSSLGSLELWKWDSLSKFVYASHVDAPFLMSVRRPDSTHSRFSREVSTGSVLIMFPRSKDMWWQVGLYWFSWLVVQSITGYEWGQLLPRFSWMLVHHHYYP